MPLEVHKGPPLAVLTFSSCRSQHPSSCRLFDQLIDQTNFQIVTYLPFKLLLLAKYYSLLECMKVADPGNLLYFHLSAARLGFICGLILFSAGRIFAFFRFVAVH